MKPNTVVGEVDEIVLPNETEYKSKSKYYLANLFHQYRRAILERGRLTERNLELEMAINKFAVEKVEMEAKLNEAIGLLQEVHDVPLVITDPDFWKRFKAISRLGAKDAR